MSTEEIVALNLEHGEKLRAMKFTPTLNEDLEPQLLALKSNDYDPPKEEKNMIKTGPSKKELNKVKKKQEKLAKRVEAKTSSNTNIETEQKTTNQTKNFSKLYGDYPLVQSTLMTDKRYFDILDLTPELAGQNIWIRGRIVNSRAVGKVAFIVLRQKICTIQAVLIQGPQVPKSMAKYTTSISLESVVDMYATVTISESPVLATTVKNLELNILEIHTVSRAQELPFRVEDAGMNVESTGLARVLQGTLLNFRWIDLRTPANQAIFRIQSGVGSLFREYLSSKNFIEIHTPKLIGGASEGGTNVFTLKYFDQPACLAQSPQLYKQMAAACAGLERVFEIGPVFRADRANSHRHLCEFTSLDFEMAIHEHYYEALDVMGELFTFIFDGLNDQYRHELRTISQQYPFEPIQYLRPSLRITFKEGIDLLRESGVPADYNEDLSTTQEKALGKIVKEKFSTDFYILDKYPSSVRPFYTMPDPVDPSLSNSYDLFIRGEEIVSGSQRVHDVDLLVQQATEKGIQVSSIQAYVDAFKHGALPHAGGGIGLERVVMLYLGLKNIRKTSMFPRDPSRLSP